MSNWLSERESVATTIKCDTTEKMAFLSSLYKALRISILNRKWWVKEKPNLNYKLMEISGRTLTNRTLICGCFTVQFFFLNVLCMWRNISTMWKLFFCSLFGQRKIDRWSEREWKIIDKYVRYQAHTQFSTLRKAVHRFGENKAKARQTFEVRLLMTVRWSKELWFSGWINDHRRFWCTPITINY